MMSLNDNEKDFQKKLQEETEIPVIVHERVNQAYRLIENNTAVQKKAPKEPYHWMKLGGRIAGGMAAVLAVGFIFCAVNPVMAKNLPVVGGLFEMLQDNVSFFGDFSDHATTLESVDTTESDIEGNSSEDTEAGQDTTKDDTAYTKTADGLTITCSEVYANSQAVYITMQFKSGQPFPKTETLAESGTPVIDLDMTGGVDFNSEASPVIDGQVEGQFLDDNTYACIFRYDLAQAAKDYTEYNEKYDEMTQQVLDEMGITMDDMDDETDEGYALLEEFINKVSERGGAYQKYIKEIDIPDTFNLHLDITKVRGLEANYQWSEEDEKKYGTDAGYYKYEGDWSFDIPVTVDDSQTEVMELNDTNDEGIGLKSVIRTPYELTVNELYEDGSDSDCFMVALDANGNKLPYNDSTGNCNNFTIQDRDISTVDIYILDYTQYMDELKGPDNYNNNENKPEGQKWSDLLDQYAKYHKTLHFD
ncbi:Uncharacterised protein [uncultured Ruminococcus sp.]|uniref:DUF4179 domain-containing protein n=1 Tax=Blautia obeum TaxID=40520 RepID=UPI000821B813|nr:DUF4179 domain-containing protein [Blautia obeum]SCI10034.1 Uncharacterised protein [uncultured Ruminococcus sp.]